MSSPGKGVDRNSNPGNSTPENSDLDKDLVTNGTDGDKGLKRNLTYSDGSTPPSQGPGKYTDVTDSSQKREATKPLSNFIKPLYPSVQDRKGVEDASEYGTRVKIVGVNLPDSQTSPYDKVLYEELWDQLVKQKAKLATAIEQISSDKLVQSLQLKEPVFNTTFLETTVAKEVTSAATKILCEYRNSGITDDIDHVATLAGTSVATGIMNHPPPTILGYNSGDPEENITFKMKALTFLNPAQQWAKDMANHCVRSGLQTPLSLYEREGILSEVHAKHAQMVNNITELKAQGHATRDQVVKVTGAVTELLNKPCDKQLRIYGLSPLIKTKLANPKDQRARSARVEEATTALSDIFSNNGYHRQFSLNLIEPASNANRNSSVVAIITLPYESDKYRIESILKENKHNYNLTCRRQVAGDHKVSNLPTLTELNTMLINQYKKKLSVDLTKLVSEGGNAEKVKTLQTKYALSKDYKFSIRKKTSDKEPKVYYEFLCPVSHQVFMTYNYADTFNQYDFTHEIANPRLRLAAEHSSGGWTKKHIKM